MAGIVILTIISFAAVLFLFYFFIALWKDGEPRVKCRVQRIGPDPDIILPVPKRAMKPFTLPQMKCEFDSGSMNDTRTRENGTSSVGRTHIQRNENESRAEQCSRVYY
jgi:hypothetical protein